MGASLEVRRFEEQPRAAIEIDWSSQVDSDRFENGHSYSGSIGMLGHEIEQWCDAMVSDERAAYAFLSDNHRKWDGAMAVSYTGENGKKRWLIGGHCAS